MLDVKHAATVALTAWEHGYPPLPDTIQELPDRTFAAHRWRTDNRRITPLLGRGWIIRRRRDQRGDRDSNAVTEAEYAVAQIWALAGCCNSRGAGDGMFAIRCRRDARFSGLQVKAAGGCDYRVAEAVREPWARLPA